MWIGAEPKRRACANIFDTINIARRYKCSLLVLFLVFGSMTWIFCSKTSPQYSATVYMEVAPLVTIGYPEHINKSTHQLILDDIQIQNQLHAMLSDEELLYAFCQIRYISDNSDPALCSQALGGTQQNTTSVYLAAHGMYRRAFFDFKRAVSARRVDLSYMIAITVWSSESSKAVRAANSVAMSYVHKGLEDSIASLSLEPSPHRELLDRLKMETYISAIAVSDGKIPDENFVDSNLRLFGSAKTNADYFPQVLPMMLLSVIIAGVSFIVAIMVVGALDPRIYSLYRIRYVIDNFLSSSAPTVFMRKGLRSTVKNELVFEDILIQKVRVSLVAAGSYSDGCLIEVIGVASNSVLDSINRSQLNIADLTDILLENQSTQKLYYSLRSIRLTSPVKCFTVWKLPRISSDCMTNTKVSAVILIIELGHATVKQVKTALYAVKATTLPLVIVILSDW